MRSLAVTLALVTLLSPNAGAQTDTQPAPVRLEKDSTLVDTLLSKIEKGVFAVAFVHEPPALISGPPIRYPPELRRRGIRGRVMVQAIVDKSGRVEPKSIKILESTHSGFEGSARSYMRHAHFKPARINGHAVRVLVTVPIEFNIAR